MFLQVRSVCVCMRACACTCAGVYMEQPGTSAICETWAVLLLVTRKIWLHGFNCLSGPSAGVSHVC